MSRFWVTRVTLVDAEGYKLIVNILIKVGVAVASFAALMTSALAAGPITGVWHGRVSFDTSKLPNISDPNQKKLMMSQIKTSEQAKITLTLNSNHTFTMITVGVPKAGKPATGTWSQAGSALTIIPNIPGRSTSPRTFSLASDTKSMSFTQSGLTIRFMR